jgi:hypothetical protein
MAKRRYSYIMSSSEKDRLNGTHARKREYYFLQRNQDTDLLSPQKPTNKPNPVHFFTICISQNKETTRKT